MGELRFDSDQQNEFVRPIQQSGFDLTGRIVAWGLAKNRRQAEYVLIAVVVLALIVIWWFGFRGGAEVVPAPVPPPLP